MKNVDDIGVVDAPGTALRISDVSQAREFEAQYGDQVIPDKEFSRLAWI